MSLGENTAGGDVYLGFGAIAVDARTETSFLLRQKTPAKTTANPTPATTQELLGVDPDSGQVRSVEDLTGRSDLRVLFPTTGVLVMSQSDAAANDRLDLFDKDSLKLLKSFDAPGRYYGTRSSPSRNYVAVADNAKQGAPIHVIDMATLEPKIVPHNGDWLEAMWLNGSDELVAIVFYNTWFGKDKTGSPHARILSWKMAAIRSSGFALDAQGMWPAPRLNIDVPNVAPELLFSFTWVGISPDDHYAVFPVMQLPNDATSGSSGPPELLVVDVTDGSLRKVANAEGPVGFTPDSQTIVSYTSTELKLIDVKTLQVSAKTVPIASGLLSYFVSHEGNFIVVGSSLGDERLVLYDVDHDTTTQMAGPGIHLTEFVSRPGHNELWLVDHAALYRLGFATGVFDLIPTTFSPAHINILPKRDRLVFNGYPANELFFFDPVKQVQTTTVNLD